MELEKFLEDDIVEFLDTQKDLKREKLTQMRSEEASLFSVDRDYAAETKAALAANNVSRAKSIFDQLRDSYNHMSKGSAEREKIYSIIQEVYSSIKEYFDSAKGASLQDEMKDVALHGLDNDAPDPVSEVTKSKPVPQKTNAPSSPPPQAITPKTPFEIAAIKAQQERDALEDDINQLLGIIRIQLHGGNLVEAVSQYRVLKELFSKYPSDDKFRKTELFNLVLGVYNDIKKSQGVAQVVAQGQKAEQRSQQERVLSRAEILSGIKAIVKTAIESLDAVDIHAAESSLIDARHRLSKLDDSYAQERQAFENVISKVSSRIQFLKSHPPTQGGKT